MYVILEISMYGSHWKKKTATMKIAAKSHVRGLLVTVEGASFRVNFFRSFKNNSFMGTALPTSRMMQAKPTHQTAGFPKSMIVDMRPFGRLYDTASH